MPDKLMLYGSNISYFTGKLENYFRLKGIAYELRAMQFPGQAAEIGRELGVEQMPALQLTDGRWMTDTTMIIRWFEAQHPEPPILPPDPLQAFLCLLLEDYADEWLWRPAMHYRWDYSRGRLPPEPRPGGRGDREHVPLPGAIKKRWLIRHAPAAADSRAATACRGH